MDANRIRTALSRSGSRTARASCVAMDRARAVPLAAGPACTSQRSDRAT